MTRRSTNKFLSNRSLAEEINLSKLSYCSFIDPAFADYAAIYEDVPEPGQIEIGTVIRVMTWEHVPPSPILRPRARRNRDRMAVNFPPFKHFLCTETGFVEVLRSHWFGGLENGHFASDHGKLTRRLGQMILLLAQRYGTRGNWRGYSWREDMEGLAVEQLVAGILMFNEARSDNPFAYASRIMQNAFIRTLHRETKQGDIRDDLLELAGAKPSIKRQIANDLVRPHF